MITTNVRKAIASPITYAFQVIAYSTDTYDAEAFMIYNIIEEIIKIVRRRRNATKQLENVAWMSKHKW